MANLKRNRNFDDGEPENFKRERIWVAPHHNLIPKTENDQHPNGEACERVEGNANYPQHLVGPYLGAGDHGLTASYTRSLSWLNQISEVGGSFHQIKVQPGKVRCLYGTACEVKAQVPSSIGDLEEVSMSFANGFYHLQIFRQRNYLLRDMNGLEVAVLDRKTTSILKQLDARFDMQYSAYISSEEWRECIISSKSTTRAAVVNVELNISGLRTDSRDVGKILSQARIYLQHPRFRPKETPYENPHYIVISDLDVSVPEAQDPDDLQPARNLLEAQSFDRILDELDQHTHLRPAEADDKIIITKLHAHQKASIDFVVQRESLKMKEAFCLWKHTKNEDTTSCYRHAILGIKKPFHPNENVGGIIADEMGLGKTLSMISAIALSSNPAKNFSAKSPLISDPRMNKPRTRATLIIVPSVLVMSVWEEEIEKHITPGYLKCQKFHGRRDHDINRLLDNDVVLTTYATISKEFSQRNSTLHQFMWYRIVLDEAHSICNQQTERFLAVKSIEAQYRWCLTGTPFQNRLEDLGALVSFLRIPYLDSVTGFRSNIVAPIEQGRKEGVSKLRSLLKCICLRRTKQVIHLPEARQLTRVLHLTAEERSEYENIIKEDRQSIEYAVSTNDTSKASSGLCQTILRLRLFCNHGFATTSRQNLDSSRNPTPQEIDEKFSFIEQNERVECMSCSQTLESFGDAENSRSGVYTHCAHLVCSGCSNQGSRLDSDSELMQFTCPVCRNFTSSIATKCLGLASPAPPESASYPSTKLNALLNDLQITQYTEKSIVFSSWTKTISAAMSLLSKQGIKYRVVEGSMSVSQRMEALKQFHGPDIPVLLMTLGTGSVGLNLTLASRIYILEPQWNPSAECQAIGRAIRLGQQNQVTVIRYILKDTVEEYIQQRQQQKSHLTTMSWSENEHNSADAKLKKFMDLSSVIEGS